LKITQRRTKPSAGSIFVAEFVVADELAVAARVVERVERRAAPPGEKPKQEFFHRALAPVWAAPRARQIRGGIWRDRWRLSSANHQPVGFRFFELALARRLGRSCQDARGVNPSLFLFFHNMLCAC
jgi:hypothetical protein